MEYVRLGTSDLLVSTVCLGTMTWGIQNSEAEAHRQLDYAISRGVNFIDTAEVYPMPPSAPEYAAGRTEEIIGSYMLTRPGVRAKLVIATKVIGYVDETTTVCSTSVVANRCVEQHHDKLPRFARLDAQSVINACVASLRRLQITYVDLLYLHWPDRYVPLFGRRAYDISQERPSVPFQDTLRGVRHLMNTGLIRAYGLSNETAFGVYTCFQTARELKMSPPAVLQNPFSLLDRRFEGQLAEMCAPCNLNIPLIPWGVLAGGTLTEVPYDPTTGGTEGTCELSSLPENSRFVQFKGFQSRFRNPAALTAATQYLEIAQRHNMSLATMSQAFCKSRWYVASTIVSAITITQLEENLRAFDIELSRSVLVEIDRIHNENKDCVVSV